MKVLGVSPDILNHTQGLLGWGYIVAGSIWQAAALEQEALFKEGQISSQRESAAHGPCFSLKMMAGRVFDGSGKPGAIPASP